MQDLYRELVLDHSRNPRHFGRIENATHTADGINPLCGDKLKLYLRVNAAGEIESSSFEGTGCAISGSTRQEKSSRRASREPAAPFRSHRHRL
jgi:nitrogen fixation NifU-like protein